MARKRDKDRERGRNGKERGGKGAEGRTAPFGPAEAARTDASSPFRPDGKLSRKAYEAALFDLHVELVKLQEWVKASVQGAPSLSASSHRSPRRARGSR